MKFLALLVFLGILAPANSRAEEQAPVVLELFTSQSCSSCPPADKILGELADEKNIIALSCNVTYWNHLHWKDTLSQEFCTQRQRQYVQTLQSRGPYTPQIVINGKHEMVGSRNALIQKTIQTEQNKTKNIHLTATEDTLEINLPDLGDTEQDSVYSLLLLAHGKTHHQDIPSGENRGRSVTYTHPVTNLVNLGEWNGKAGTLSHDIGEMAASGYAILAQKDGITGPITAAGQIKPAPISPVQ